MTLLFDIGNTSIKMAIVENDEIIKRYVFSTPLLVKSDDFYLRILPLVKDLRFKRVAIASVVPSKTEELRKMVKDHFSIEAFVIKPGIKTGVKIIADYPLEVGADIICASARYPSALIIDLGTAIKYLFIDNNSLLGVVIGPGLETSLKALTDNTALLPHIEIKAPKTILGKNTIHCMQSGITYGMVSQIEGMIHKIEKETRKKVPVYITGGYAEKIYPLIEREITYVPNLVLEGLLIILNKNI